MLPKLSSHFLFIVALFSCGCHPSKPAASKANKVDVVVSILPQAFFVEQIGGPHVRVSVLVPAGRSPETFSPTPKQMAEFTDADLFFRIGISFEERLVEVVKADSPQLKIIDTREGVEMRRLQGHYHQHEDGESHFHDEGMIDPHIWLDPMRVKIQVATMRDALKQADPDHAADYDTNARAFCIALDQVHEDVTRKLSPYRGSAFFVFHPAFGYFGEAYNLKQVAVEMGGRTPGPRRLGALIDLAKEVGASAVFVETQTTSRSVEAVAEAIGCAIVRIDPLARDYLDNLSRVAAAIAESMQRSAGAVPDVGKGTASRG